jgi:DNA-binding CsgD family transcriptional regulator
VAVAAAGIAQAVAEAGDALARAKLLPAQVQIAAAAGDLDTARAAAGDLDGVAAQFGTPALQAAAGVARGRLRLAEGDAGGATSALRPALRLWQQLDVPYEVATTHLLLGLACRDLGDEDGAAACLGAAHAGFRKLGAARDLAAVEELVDTGRQAGLPGGLSAREAEVLRLVAAGLTNKQIAGELYLSQKTVARHLSNIFVKIGVATRAAATAWAFEHGVAGGG